MRLVSEQSDAEIQASRALANLKPALRRLAANMMRVVRGAGSSAEFGDQMVACINAMVAYQDATGHGVASWDLDQMLDPDAAYVEYRPWINVSEKDQARWDADGTTDRKIAEQDIRRASLQVVASMLVNQTPQQRRGEHDFFEGIRRLEDERERSRVYHQARSRPAARRPRKPKCPPTSRRV